jgi:hypothetical protein
MIAIVQEQVLIRDTYIRRYEFTVSHVAVDWE